MSINVALSDFEKKFFRKSVWKSSNIEHAYSARTNVGSLFTYNVCKADSDNDFKEKNKEKTLEKLF